jgi:L-ribulose-5-phosphate 3-epimerase
MDNKIGLSLWTIYGWRPQETVTPLMLQTIASLGAQAVELVVDEAFHSEEVLMAQQGELRAALEAAGLEVPSVASALFWRYNLASQDEALRRKGMTLIEQECRVAKAFGGQAILVVAGLQEPRTEYQRTYETAVRTLRQAAPYAQDMGIAIGVEHVPCNFLTSPGEFAQFLADVDHPAVQAYADVGNAWGTYGGYPENWVRAVKGHIAMVHVKDYSEKDGFTVCGHGNLNWTDALEALREAGYTRPLIVETPPDYGRRGQDIPAGIEAARESVSWLQEFMRTVP